MRKSTRTTSAAASARQKKNAEKSKERASKKTKKVIKILTQEEKLKEAGMRRSHELIVCGSVLLDALKLHGS